MKTPVEARERAKELALQHGNTALVARHLEEEGFGGLLDRYEMEAIVTEVDYIRRMLPEAPKKRLPRTIGVISVVMGIAAMSLDAGIPSVRRYSPSGYGLVALILGLILIVKPSAANTDL